MQCFRYIAHILTCLLIGVLLIAGGSTAHAETKSYRYDLIDVRVQVARDGTLDVAETMTLAYTGGPFRSANRSIPLERFDDVRDIALSEGAQRYTESEGSAKTPATFTVERNGSAVNIKWFYEPTSDTTRTFTLHYTVRGAVWINSSGDELWWVAIFPDRTVPVQQSRVTLTLPDGAQLSKSDLSLPQADGMITVEENTARVVRDEPLPGGQSLDVQVCFPAALVSASKPAWQVTAEAPLPTYAPQPTRVDQPIGASSSQSSSSRKRSLFDPMLCLAIPLMLLSIGLWLHKGITTGDWGSSNNGRSYRSHHRSSGSWGSSSNSSSSSSG